MSLADSRVRCLACLTADGVAPRLGEDEPSGDVATTATLAIMTDTRGHSVLTLGDGGGAESGDARAYVAWPSLVDPRLIAAVSPVADVLGWYASTPRRRAASVLLRARMGGERFTVTGPPPAIVESWAAMTGDTASGLSVFNGTAGPLRRPMSIVLDHAGRPLAFVRCAFDDEGRTSLEQEASLLRSLTSDPGLAQSVPEVVDASTQGRIATMYMRAVAAGPGPGRPGPAHAAFQRHMSRREAAETLFEGLPTVMKAAGLIADERVTPEDAETGRRLMERCRSRSPLTIATCLQHRDFARWNTGLLPDGALYVYDWEFAKPGYPVTHDLMHFVWAPLFLRGSKAGTGVAAARHAWSLCDEGSRPSFDLALSLYMLDTWAAYAGASTVLPECDRRFLDWIAESGLADE